VSAAYFLGLDISTTGSKALLVNENGVIVATTTSPHTLYTPRPLWSEQDPHEWWKVVSVSIRSVLQQTGASGESVQGSRLDGADARAGAAGWGWGGAASKVYNTSTGSGSINLPFTLIAHGDILVMKPGLSTIHLHLGVSKFRIFLGDKS